MNKEIDFNLNNVNEEILNQLRKEAGKDAYHWFKMKMEDGSELDLVEKKYFEQLQQENKELEEKIETLNKYIKTHNELNKEDIKYILGGSYE